MLSRGLVGLPLWDHGQRDAADVDYCTARPDFYRRELETKLEKLRPFTAALELMQEAHYQDERNGSWSSLDLSRLSNFKAFLLTNRMLAVHARTQDVDITDYENHLHRDWSVRESQRCIDFAFDLGADVLVLHPGSYNQRSGRFWPKPEDALAITNHRRVAFGQSLRELVAHFAIRVAERERALAQIEESRERSWVVGELKGLAQALDLERSDEDARYRLICEIFRRIESQRLPVWLVRHCLDPQRAVRLALENVEPPNFLVNTPRQIASWHERMVEALAEAFDAQGLEESAIDRYRPGIVLDPSHLLNATVLLTQPTHHPIGHIFEDYDQLFRPFVTLPCDLPVGAGRRLQEPILNALVRRHDRDIVYSHLAGCQKMGSAMTTHDPIKPFRSRAFMQVGSDGHPLLRFATGTFDPDVELNLEEVVQVVGFEKTYVLTVFDRPDEMLISSHINVQEYLSYLHEEYRRTHGLLVSVLESVQSQRPDGTASAQQVSSRVWEAGRVLKDLERARFYLKPHRLSRDLWKVGYQEAGFYLYDEGYDQARSPSPVRIFATTKGDTDGAWIEGLTP